MPRVRPFRALRYSSEVVPDLGAVVAPPYDVISPAEQRALLARDPRNVVRLDFPPVEPGDADEDERYRRAGRLLRAWRADGVLRRDTRPALYPYEQSYRLPGDSGDATVRVRRGVFARLGLEPFGPGSGIRPHERTMAAPKEDRYRLLRATSANTSPVVGLYDDPIGAIAAWLTSIAEDRSPARAPVADLIDDAGTRHRLWVVPMPDGDDGLPARIGAGPITIADGHHRYETALRYRDERRHGQPDDEDAPWDDILALLLEPDAGRLDVLATHRVLRRLGDERTRALAAGLPELFEIRAASRDELVETFRPSSTGPAGGGRFGVWTRAGGAVLTAGPASNAAGGTPGTPPGPSPGTAVASSAVAALDVSRLGAALERLAGIDPAAVDAGETMAYTKDSAEAIRWVDEAHDGADVAFLLDPTPAAAIVAVAAEGDVMPQKSTYIYPKALTGLVINPLE